MWINRKKFDLLKQETEKLLDSIEKLKNRPILIGIERVGRTNKFTFMRGKEIIQIETMGLISDNIPAWKEQLLN